MNRHEENLIRQIYCKLTINFSNGNTTGSKLEYLIGNIDK